MVLSSIGNGGIGTKCAETTTRKKCANSQGQIFQECQGQIPKVKFPRSNISGMPRSNSQGQISQGQIFQECQGQISQGQIPKVKWENKNGKNAKVKYFRNLWNVRNVRNFRNVWNVRNVKTKMGNTK